MEYKDREQQIRKGQALNLAYQIAIADGKSEDKRYIVKKVVEVLDVINTVQTLSIAELKDIKL